MITVIVKDVDTMAETEVSLDEMKIFSITNKTYLQDGDIKISPKTRIMSITWLPSLRQLLILVSESGIVNYSIF